MGEQTGVEEDTLWSIAEELKPGARPVAENAKVRRLAQHFRVHNERDDGAEWRYIDIYVDGDILFQYSKGVHNMSGLTDEERERVSQLIDEEDLDIVAGDVEEGYVTLMAGRGVDEDVRIAGRILGEIYDSSFEDIEKVIEIADNNRENSWTKVEAE